MTENPAQGASPENREPATPNEGAAGRPQAAPAPDSPQDTPAPDTGQDSPQENPTLRLDRAAGNPPQPVYPQHQPSYGRPPAAETQQFGAPQEYVHQAGASGQPNQQHTPGYGQATNTTAFGQPQQGSAQHGPFQHGQPPYSQARHGGFSGNPSGSPYASDPAHAPKRKAAFGVPTLVASILAAGLVGGGVVAGTTQLMDERSITSTGSSNSSQAGPVIVNNREDVNAITAAAVKATPSVVTIKASNGSEGGTGSGIILDGEGHVLTNTHVVTLDGTVANAAIEVRMSDGKVYSATIVGTDPLSDLAVVKIKDGSGLVPAVLGDSGKLNVGDTAVAIGSPLGLTGTVTDGIVSTLNRTISVASSAAPKEGADNSQGDDQGFQFAPPDGGQGQTTADQGSISINVIQTDAAINPGNSGGALVNTKGEIIGVNVAIASAGGESSSSGNIGVGFSIPINHAKRVAQEIISTGKATHGQFGVSVKQKTASDSASGFSVGAEVATVEPGSAADKAGVKVGDIVTKFQDLTISDPNQLTAAVREQPAGASVKVTVIRGGEEQQLDVTLGAAAEQ
ncbi:S1C family serine protease [Arthrobacter sp. U41]|uniref:S1C family serine protease n=1 Tax=Arthrobacter sp. U41 TaxID=1849032 RepID=UPI0011A9E42B|nr:trypsin-like peptidase domain-containing protein [Arthrobacter sp. U41]